MEKAEVEDIAEMRDYFELVGERALDEARVADP